MYIKKCKEYNNKLKDLPQRIIIRNICIQPVFILKKKFKYFYCILKGLLLLFNGKYSFFGTKWLYYKFKKSISYVFQR